MKFKKMNSLVVVSLASCALFLSCAQKSEAPIQAQPTPEFAPDTDIPPRQSSGLTDSANSSLNKQRIVCVGGAAQSNLQTFTIESNELAIPSNTLIQDPVAPEFPLVGAQNLTLLDDPSPTTEEFRLSFQASSLAPQSGALRGRPAAPQLYVARLNRMFRTIESRSIATFASLNPRVASAYRQLGILSPERYGFDARQRVLVALNASGAESFVEETLLDDLNTITARRAVSATDWAQPLTDENGFLLNGIDSIIHGKLRKFYLSKKLPIGPQKVPDPLQPDHSAWGGAALGDSRWFWFEGDLNQLYIAFWDTQRGDIVRVALPLGQPLLPRSITWKRQGDAIKIFLATETAEQIFAHVFTVQIPAEFKPGTASEANLAISRSVHKKDLRLKAESLLQLKVELRPSPRFDQMLVLDTISEPVNHVTVLDFASGTLSNKHKVGCNHLALFTQGQEK